MRMLNIALRAATLASRFLLVFFLARFLEPAQLGLYGLLTATVGYSLYLVGLDFYTFTTREILKTDRKEWGGLLKDQAVLSLVLYAIFLPLLGLIFVTELLPWRFAGWFLGLVVLEHINQELGRLLIAISDQLVASVVLFIRQGTWAIAIAALMAVEPATRALDYVLGAWAVAGISAVLTGAYRLKQLDIAGWHRKVDWSWIISGLKVSIPLLAATLALRGVFTLDRYWVQALVNLEMVGVYVLFMGIAGALMAFLDAGVFAFSYPGLIAAYQNNQPGLFSKNIRKLLVQTCALSVAFAIVSGLLLSPLLGWLANPLYVERSHIFPWILIAMMLYAIGMIPHYALYAQGIDRPIIQSHIASLVVFSGATWMIAKYSPLLAVPLALCAAFALILFWKAWAFIELTPPEFRVLRARAG